MAGGCIAARGAAVEENPRKVGLKRGGFVGKEWDECRREPAVEGVHVVLHGGEAVPVREERVVWGEDDGGVLAREVEDVLREEGRVEAVRGDEVAAVPVDDDGARAGLRVLGEEDVGEDGVVLARDEARDLLLATGSVVLRWGCGG